MKKMIFALTAATLALAGCTQSSDNAPRNDGHMGGGMHRGDGSVQDGERQRGMGGMMTHGNAPSLGSSAGINELAIPPLLEKQPGKEFDYEVTAQQGSTEFFDGVQTATYGYNGDLLGPTLRLEEGSRAKVKITNDLNEPTTFHWHGLEVPADIDGGPHGEIQPGDSQVITLEADQPASTLWYHPHVHGNTAEQVFKGLAGLLLIDPADPSGLPADYGIDDIPLVFQDRLFDEERQLDYSRLMDLDGTLGDISMVNGTLDPKLTVKEPVMRFRLLNGANARNYTFRLSNGENFTQIATDGGLLEEPVETDTLTLSPSERAEILIDFSAMKVGPVAIVDEEGVELLPFDLAFSEAPTVADSWAADAPFVSEEEKALPVSKEIELFGMMDMVTINGRKYDPDRIDLRQQQGKTEVWEIHNRPDMMGGMIHPFHIHGTQFKIMSRDGKETAPHERGLKDSVLVEPGERVKLLVTFPETGVYVFHCHILEHEDNGMMGQIEVYE